jgi:hypothetical protein
MDWFMASHLAARVYLLCNEQRTLIAGLPLAQYKHQDWFSSSYQLLAPKEGMQVHCFDSQGQLIGSCICRVVNICDWLDGKPEGHAWKFVPNVPKHKPGVKFHPNYKESIPTWATPLITKWVLCE